MKSIFRFGAAAALLAATLVGCDWGGVSSEESWNDAYAWANFSGTYKFVTEVIVPEDNDTGSGDADSNDNFSNYPDKDHSVTIANINKAGDFKFTVPRGDYSIKPGSVTVTLFYLINKGTAQEKDEYLTLKDNGSGKLLYGGNAEHTYNGEVEYTTGKINGSSGALYVKYAEVTYSYYYKAGSSASISSDSSSGSASSPITWLNVTQKGNLLTLQDNDGRTYAGKITGASCPDADAAGYVTAGHIRFSFEATCTSNAKYKISGSLSGNWSGAQNETSGTISDRTMDASFSDGGSPIQFQAVSGSVTVVARTVTPVAGAY